MRPKRQIRLLAFLILSGISLLLAGCTGEAPETPSYMASVQSKAETTERTVLDPLFSGLFGDLTLEDLQLWIEEHPRIEAKTSDETTRGADGLEKTEQVCTLHLPEQKDALRLVFAPDGAFLYALYSLESEQPAVYVSGRGENLEAGALQLPEKQGFYRYEEADHSWKQYENSEALIQALHHE